MRLFPQPVTEELNVFMEGMMEGDRNYNIYAVSGEEIRRGRLSTTGKLGYFRIPVSDLLQGVYLITIGGAETASRFVKL